MLRVLKSLSQCCLNVCRTQSAVAQWKLSPHENRARMRPKLVPNHKFDPHLEASRLRDNEGEDSSDNSLWPTSAVDYSQTKFVLILCNIH